MSTKEKKIQDPDGLYTFLRRYVDFMIFRAYRKIEYVGKEKIPSDGAIIYSPNHTNALMDALVILSADNSRKVFIARADIFKRPLLKKILTFLKILPINRIRDGWSNLTKTNDTLEKSADVLKDRVPLCILPEGTHNAQHSLLPVGKGVFRVAYAGITEIKEEFPLYIIPVGIEYGNFFRYYSTVLVNIGDPINMDEYISLLAEQERPEVMNMGKEYLSDKMKELILYVPRDDYYQATWDLAAVIYSDSGHKNITGEENGDSYLVKRYKTNRSTLESIRRIREEKPAKSSELLDLAKEFSQKRIKKGISLSSIIKPGIGAVCLRRLLLFIVTLPFFALYGALTILVHLMDWIINSMSKDRAFDNSIRFVVTLVFWPVSLIIWGVIYFVFMPWEYALPALLLSVPAIVIIQELWRNARLMLSDLKLLFHKGIRLKIKELKSLYYDLKQ